MLLHSHPQPFNCIGIVIKMVLPVKFQVVLRVIKYAFSDFHNANNFLDLKLAASQIQEAGDLWKEVAIKSFHLPEF